jgi:hypothetical protein
MAKHPVIKKPLKRQNSFCLRCRQAARYKHLLLVLPRASRLPLCRVCYICRLKNGF